MEKGDEEFSAETSEAETTKSSANDKWSESLDLTIYYSGITFYSSFNFLDRNLTCFQYLPKQNQIDDVRIVLIQLFQLKNCEIDSKDSYIVELTPQDEQTVFRDLERLLADQNDDQDTPVLINQGKILYFCGLFIS